MKKLVVGIDATNLRRGGGKTHLIELLRAVDPEACDVERVIVWGTRDTLASLGDEDWLGKVNPPALDGGLFRRTFWQRYSLSRAARAAGCNVLFVPGGSYAGDFHPVVTMCRNMLPFEWRELRRYGWSMTTLRLLLLRFAQSRAFRRADGVIFLTRYAQQLVSDVIGSAKGSDVIIPHGLNPRFRINPKDGGAPSEYTENNPCRLLYVSIINRYKHQHHVVEAVKIIHDEGVPVTLDLVGPAYPPALKRLQSVITRVDPEKSWVHYHGAVPYETLHQTYAQADIGIFASSCENMPNILLETMAAGLPIACSDRGPMKEILGDAGVYFDPEDPHDVANALYSLIKSPELRTNLSNASFTTSKQYTWEWCADETFRFLVQVHRQYLQK